MSNNQVEFVTRKISELSNWEDNPRSIVEADFKRLKQQISELGFYKTLLINQDNIVLGGNMRLRALKDLGFDEILCGLVKTENTGDMLRYALSDNDQVGVTDDLKLAELVHLNPIETTLFKVQSNVLRPLESIVNPPDPVTEGGESEADRNDLGDRLDTYLNGTVKQVVLYFSNDEYIEFIDKLEELGKLYDVENNTEIIKQAVGETLDRLKSKKES